MIPRVGQKFYRGREMNRYEVRAIVDGSHVVVRQWWNSKRRYNYIVEPLSYFAEPFIIFSRVRQYPPDRR